MYPLYDAHNHLQDAWLAPYRAAVFAELGKLPLRSAVVNGTAENDWAEVEGLGVTHAFVQPSFGLHPWHVGNASALWRDRLTEILQRHPTAPIGEIGVDRWMLDRARPDDLRLKGLVRAPLAAQIEALRWQLALAAREDRAATLHCLDAWGPLTELLRAMPLPARGFLLHAYGGSAELARELARYGAYFSFSGYFLGDRQRARQAVFETLPLDRLLVETDAPAMPLTDGKREFELPPLPDGTALNHPANLRAVYLGLASIRKMPVEELAAIVAANFQRLFGPTGRAR